MRSGFFPACVLRKASTEGQWEPLSGCTALPRTANNEGTEWCGWIREPHGDVSRGTKLFLVVRIVIGSFVCKVCFVHPESTDCTELFFFLLLKKGKSSWLEEWTCIEHPSHARKSHKLEIQEGELKFLTSFLIEILVLTVFQVYLIYRRLIILMTLREVSLCLEKKKDYWKKVQRRWEGLRWYVVLRRDLEQRPWFVQQVCSKPSRLEGMWKCLVHDLLMPCLISLVPLPWHLTAISTSSVSAFRQEPAAPEPCVVFPFSKIHQGKCFSWRQECTVWVATQHWELSSRAGELAVCSSAGDAICQMSSRVVF